MSKRFGRNQRRRAREQLDAVQHQAIQEQERLKMLLEMTNEDLRKSQSRMPHVSQYIMPCVDMRNGLDFANSTRDDIDRHLRSRTFYQMDVGCDYSEGLDQGYIAFVAVDDASAKSALMVDMDAIKNAKAMGRLKNLTEQVAERLMAHFHQHLSKQGR